VAIVFEVNDEDGELSFEATRLNNVIRAALPPPLIRRSYIEVGGSDEPSTEERDALTGVLAPGGADTLERSTLVAYIASFHPTPPSVLLGEEFSATIADGVLVMSDEVLPVPTADPVDPLEPATTAQIAFGALAALAVMCSAGYGPARVVLRDTADALALAPAVGAASLMLVAFALERLGLPLEGRLGPWVVSAFAIVGGLAFGLVGQRRAVAEPPA
jgi:hypothetical protein